MQDSHHIVLSVGSETGENFTQIKTEREELEVDPPPISCQTLPTPVSLNVEENGEIVKTEEAGGKDEESSSNYENDNDVNLLQQAYTMQTELLTPASDQHPEMLGRLNVSRNQHREFSFERNDHTDLDTAPRVIPNDPNMPSYVLPCLFQHTALKKSDHTDTVLCEVPNDPNLPSYVLPRLFQNAAPTVASSTVDAMPTLQNNTSSTSHHQSSLATESNTLSSTSLNQLSAFVANSTSEFFPDTYYQSPSSLPPRHLDRIPDSERTGADTECDSLAPSSIVQSALLNVETERDTQSNVDQTFKVVNVEGGGVVSDDSVSHKISTSSSQTVENPQSRTPRRFTVESEKDVPENSDQTHAAVNVESDDTVEAEQDSVQQMYSSYVVFLCLVCKRVFMSEQEQRNHCVWSNHTRWTKKQVHECDTCRARFQFLHCIKKHVALHINDTHQKTSTAVHRNANCNSSSAVNYSGTAEMNSHHGLNTETGTVVSQNAHDVVNKPQSHGQNGEKPTKDNLMIEIDSSGNESVVEINEVEPSLSDYNANEAVVKTTSVGSKYTCKVCYKTFRYPSDLARHKLTHSGEKPHVCDQKSRLHRKRKVGASENAAIFGADMTGQGSRWQPTVVLFDCFEKKNSRHAQKSRLEKRCDKRLRTTIVEGDDTNSTSKGDNTNSTLSVKEDNCSESRSAENGYSSDTECEEDGRYSAYTKYEPSSTRDNAKRNKRKFTSKCDNTKSTSRRNKPTVTSKGKRLTSFSKRNKQKQSSKRIKYQCLHCEKEFKLKKVLRKHVSKQHKKKEMFSCGVCKKTFQNKVTYEDHLDWHNNVKSHTCHVCSKAFSYRRNLNTHVSESHSKVNCMQCDQTFAGKIRRRRHMRTVHKWGTILSCETCNEKFYWKTAYEDHIDWHNGVQNHVCHICSKAFSYRRKLYSHMSLHHSDMHLQCTQCGLTFKSKGRYNYHMKTEHSQESHECQHCGKTYRTAMFLQRHVVRMHEERSDTFICHICGKSFNMKDNMRRHINLRHRGRRKMKEKQNDEKHACGECGKEYTTIHALKDHLDVHRGGQYPCPLCPMVLKTRYSLSAHKYKHKDTYKRNKRIYENKIKEKKYECTFCSKRFDKKFNLTKHERVHTGQKPYVCAVCDKDFAESSNLTKHMKVHSELDLRINKMTR